MLPQAEGADGEDAVVLFSNPRKHVDVEIFVQVLDERVGAGVVQPHHADGAALLSSGFARCARCAKRQHHVNGCTVT